MTLLSDSLIAHYKMNDNAATPNVIDETGDHDGTAQQNTSVIHRAGKINGAFDFNGTTDYIDLGTGTFDWSVDFSFVVWVNPDTIDTSGQANGVSYILSQVTLTPTRRTYIIQKDADLRIQFGTTGTVTVAPNTFEVGKWVFLTFAYNATTGVITTYTNTIKITGYSAVGLTASTGDFLIGKAPTNNWFDGLIDNVMFFSKELTLNDIKLLHNGGAGRETIPIGIENHLSRTGHSFSSMQGM